MMWGFLRVFLESLGFMAWGKRVLALCGSGLGAYRFLGFRVQDIAAVNIWVLC